MAQRIPPQLVQDIMAANDIIALVGQYVRLKRSGSDYVGLCPFHKEKTPSFHVSPDRQLYYCFGCSTGGSVIDFVKNIEHLDFVEAVRFLAERAGMSMDTESFSEADKRRADLKKLYLEINKAAAHFFRDSLFTEEGKAARAYILKRKLTPQTVRTYGLGYAPDTWDALTKAMLAKGYKKEHLVAAGVSSVSKNGKVVDRFRARLMFPIIDIRGNLIAFGGRRLDDEKPKYLNTAETAIFNKGNHLFSLQLAKKSDALILVEGYMDVISLYQNGITNAVASLGTALTPEQARLCAKCAERVTICYDTDEAGVKAALRAIEVFQGVDVRLRILSLPDGKDPDEYIKLNGAVKFKELLEKAETPAGFKIMLLRKRYNLTDAYQKMEYTEACAKIISGVASGVEREVLRERVAKETGIGAGVIAREIVKRDRKEEKSQRWAVRPRQTIQPVKGKNMAAEKLLSLCLKDRAIYTKYKDILSTVLEDKLHLQILEYLEETGEAAMIVSRFAEEEVSQATAALSMPVHYENNDKAARELVHALQKETYERKVKAAADAGDLETLNALLMKNKEKEGGC